MDGFCFRGGRNDDGVGLGVEVGRGSLNRAFSVITSFLNSVCFGGFRDYEQH